MQHFARGIFRLGPILLLLLMMAASEAYYPWRHYDSWMVYAILLGAAASAVWHLALIVIERSKTNYLLICVDLFNAYM